MYWAVLGSVPSTSTCSTPVPPRSRTASKSWRITSTPCTTESRMYSAAVSISPTGRDGKPGGMGKIRRQAEGVAAAALVQHGQTQHARVQGDAVAEQKQKDERQHPGHQIGGRIPHYLLKFLAHQGHKLLYPQRFFHPFHRQFRSPRAAAPPFIGGAPCRNAQYWR